MTLLTDAGDNYSSVAVSVAVYSVITNECISHVVNFKCVLELSVILRVCKSLHNT